MIRSVINWIIAFISGQRALLKIDRGFKKIDRIKKQQKVNSRKLSKHKQDIEEMIDEFDVAVQKINDDIDGAERIKQQLSRELESVRSKLEVADDVTIPTLVAAHQLLLKRYEAETAIEVRKSVAASSDVEQ